MKNTPNKKKCVQWRKWCRFQTKRKFHLKVIRIQCGFTKDTYLYALKKEWDKIMF